eukprot:3661119-Pleurochrysis_carterae.AAC.1
MKGAYQLLKTYLEDQSTAWRLYECTRGAYKQQCKLGARIHALSQSNAHEACKRSLCMRLAKGVTLCMRRPQELCDLGAHAHMRQSN